MKKYYQNLFIFAFVPCLFIIGGMASTVSAQDTIEVDTRVVAVSVSVRDSDGKFVSSLTKDDFDVFDNKTKREIEFFAKEDAAVSYGIVYDLHPTTSPETKTILQSLKAFTNSLGSKDDFFLTIFNEYGSLNLNFIPSIDQIDRHLSFGERNEPNSLYDAVFFAGQKLQTRDNQKRTLIIISDGKDDKSHHSFSELSRLLRSFNVQIYGVILDDKDSWKYDDVFNPDQTRRISIDESKLEAAAIKALSNESGGSSESPQIRNSIALYKIFEKIAMEMRSSYTLAFYPIEGEKHSLKITIKNQDKRKMDLGYRNSFVIPKQ